MTRQPQFQSGEFRQALGTFATGVTVVTASSDTGELAGLTANSFTSVSLDPPLILWCLSNSSDSLPVFQKTGYFAVNVLAADQQDLSRHFARKQKDKFFSVNYRKGKGGAPLLDGCVTWLQCRAVNHYLAGDHHVFIGEVEQIETSGKEALLYHQGSYAMSLPLPDSNSNEALSPPKETAARSNLYSLLVQAIHIYQERFEARQNEVVDNKYEARLLILLNEPGNHDAGELSRKIQIPRTETESILADMQTRGLLTIASDGGAVALTGAGADKAVILWELVRQHETYALGLLGPNQAQTFRKNLQRLIDWDNT